MGTLKKKKQFYTRMKNYFPYSEANISAVSQEIPPRFLTQRLQAVLTMTSLLYSEYSPLAHHSNV